MKSDIETLEKRRMRFLELYLIGFAAFVILSVTRFFFRLSGLNSQPVGTAVLFGLIICLLFLSISVIGHLTLERKIKDDPGLKEALYDELIQSLELRSWKAAYCGAVATTIFFAVAWFFYPVCDPVMIALTSVINGAGAYQATFYFKYRLS
jgi:hypothetical protein